MTQTIFVVLLIVGALVYLGMVLRRAIAGKSSCGCPAKNGCCTASQVNTEEKQISQN